MILWLSMTWMCLGVVFAAATPTTLPWLDQERLSYDISCGPIKLGVLVLNAQQAVGTKPVGTRIRISPFEILKQK